MSDQAILRITREVHQIQQGKDLSLAIKCNESDIRNMKALVVGPQGTPYEFGFSNSLLSFLKIIQRVRQGSQHSRQIRGVVGLIPTSMREGKSACASILGTWPGDKGEEWSPAQGLESVLISIQSLMSSNPNENEPGYEKANSEADKRAMGNYIAKIRHETLRIAVIQPLEEALRIQNDGKVSPSPQNGIQGKLSAREDECGDDDEAKQRVQHFDDLRKQRFLWYYESYMHTVEVESKKVKESQHFEEMGFEDSSNVMRGVFNYPELSQRLKNVHTEIMRETKCWAIHGLDAKNQDSRIASNLYRQYRQIVEDFGERKYFSLDLSLINDNPFVWLATYFGRPMTNLDGGIFRIKIHLSINFPDEQPRVVVETPIFHHRVSKDGVLCYFTSRVGELKYHIDAIIQAIEDESSPFDPRAQVNLEAAKLFWGTPAERKKYTRALRRSVEESSAY